VTVADTAPNAPKACQYRKSCQYVVNLIVRPGQ
jgi:hypothetical protein